MDRNLDHKAILTVRTLQGVTVTLFTNGHEVWNGCTIPPVPLDDFLDAVSGLKEWSADGYQAAIDNVVRPDHGNAEHA